MNKNYIQNPKPMTFDTEYLHHHERELVFLEQNLNAELQLNFKAIKPVLIGYAMEYGGICHMESIKISTVIERLEWRFYPHFSDIHAAQCREYIREKSQKGVKHEK